MSPQPADPTLRESIDDLGDRLARIGAAASTLRNLSPQVKHGIPPATLLKLTEDLRRDLMLASRQLEVVHSRAALELASARDVPRSE